ncbi:sensor histidine kinase [Shewanella sp.]|uniref:sensor histidine kinase n=1 Tax=Shewanella sp. TaxID=50422 RepID=UPI00404852D2
MRILANILVTPQSKIWALICAGIALFMATLVGTNQLDKVNRSLQRELLQKGVQRSFAERVRSIQAEVKWLQQKTDLLAVLPNLLKYEPSTLWVGTLDSAGLANGTLVNRSPGFFAPETTENQVLLLTLTEEIGSGENTVVTAFGRSPNSQSTNQLIFLWQLAPQQDMQLATRTNHVAPGFGIVVTSLDMMLGSIGQAYNSEITTASDPGLGSLTLRLGTATAPIHLNVIDTTSGRKQLDPLLTGNLLLAFVSLALLVLAGNQLRIQITEKERLRKALQEVEEKISFNNRLVTIGEISSKIAHELNQPLFAIEAYAATLTRRKDTTSEVRDLLNKVRSEAMRASRIVQTVRGLSKGGIKGNGQDVAMVEKVLEQMRPLLEDGAENAGVNLKVTIDPSVRHAKVNKTCLEQTLVNLFENALEALQIHGQAAPSVEIDFVVTQGGLLQLMVTDNGPGIDSTMEDKLFDPFVTTKESGTGLGLSICKSLLTREDGKIYCANTSHQKGASFVAEMKIYE